MNSLTYFAVGGQAMNDYGSVLGICPPWFRKSWAKISSRFGRIFGSPFKIFWIKSRAGSEMFTCSGKV